MVTLSFLKLLKKERKHVVKNLALSCGDIRRRRENRNMGEQLHFGRFTSRMTFGVHNLVRYEPFLDNLCKI